jgi:hypothetical protein
MNHAPLAAVCLVLTMSAVQADSTQAHAAPQKAASPRIAAALATDPKNPKNPVILPEEKVNTWTLSAGLQWRQIGTASFRNDAEATTGALPSLAGSAGSGGGATDGYVLPDSAGGATTWNWGYSNASQVQGNRLLITTASGEGGASFTLSRSLNSNHSADLASLGFFTELESPVFRKWKRATLSFTAGYSFNQDDMSNSALAWSAVQFSGGGSTTTTAYDISGLAPVPGAGHAGTFNGPGPVIPLTGTVVSSSGTVGSEAISDTYTSTLDQDLTVRLHTLSIGPRLGWDFGRVRGIASLGFAANIANWDAQSTETLANSSGDVLRRWQNRELGAQARLSKRWVLTASGRYDWSQSLAANVGPHNVNVGLGGWTARLGLGYQF